MNTFPIDISVNQKLTLASIWGIIVLSKYRLNCLHYTNNEKRNVAKSHNNATTNEPEAILAYIRASDQVFTDIFNEYLKSSGKQQKQIAQELNVDPAAIVHWRKGRRIPMDSDTIYKLSHALSLNAKQKQDLLTAWLFIRELRALEQYVMAAMEAGDEISDVIQPIIQSWMESLSSGE